MTSSTVNRSKLRVGLASLEAQAQHIRESISRSPEERQIPDQQLLDMLGAFGNTWLRLIRDIEVRPAEGKAP